MKVQNRRIYSFDKFELDADNRQLRRDDTPLPLPPKAFDLLLALVESSGRLVGKDELFTSVWQDQIVEESNLTVYISQIRKALGETKRGPRFIETVPGYGYRFVADLEDSETEEEIIIETETLSRITIEKESPENSVKPARSLPGSKIQGSRKKQFYPAVAALALIAIVGGVFWASSRTQTNIATAPVVEAEKQPHIKRLTAKGTVNFAVLSPDGKFFAYSLRERDSYQDSLWLAQTNGSSDVRLRPAENLAYISRTFSADGNWLYYAASEPRRFTGTLYKIPVLGGIPQKLLSDVSVYLAVSPDEKQVAFIRGNNENKTSALVIANLDGSGEREIVARPAGQAFSPVTVSWSADGAFLAFAALHGAGASYEIFTVKVADRSVRQITSLEWITIARVEWLRDGGGLMAVARDKNSTAAAQLWRVDAETGKAQKITRDLQHYGSSLSLAADSKSLLAIQATRASSLWIAPAENLAAARQVTFGSSGQEGWHGVEWTPDGKIIYTVRADQNLTLWIMNADGTNARQITSNGFLDESPSATADGKYIVFQSNRSGKAEIWRMNSDGTDLRQLTFDGKNTFPHSSPDSQTVVYSHEADGTKSVRRVSIDGGEAVQITANQSSDPRFSPDGKFIACGYFSDGKTKLAIVPVAGGTDVKLFDVPPTFNFTNSIRWSPDGRFISYRDWANGIWSQPVAGGKPELLAGLPAEKFYTFGWSPGGKQFAFTRGREVRDVVLITDF